MNTFKKTITVLGDWFNLYVFGDWHLGSADSDQKRIEDTAKFLSKKKSSEAGVILVGDLIENVLPGSKGTPFELSIPDPDKQAETACDYIRSFSHLILGSVEGNHELRSRKRTGQFVNKSMMEKIYGPDAKNRYLGLNGLIHLTFKNSKGKKLYTYTIYVTHGNGNSSTLSGKYMKIHSLRDMAKADIYVQGHLHCKLGMCDYINESNIIKKRAFVCCSSYLFEASYAQEFGYRPTDFGFNKISLNTKYNNIIGYF